MVEMSDVVGKIPVCDGAVTVSDVESVFRIPVCDEAVTVPVCDDDAVTVESSVETRYFGEVRSEQLLSADVEVSLLVDVPRV